LVFPIIKKERAVSVIIQHAPICEYKTEVQQDLGCLFNQFLTTARETARLSSCVTTALLSTFIDHLQLKTAVRADINIAFFHVTAT